MLFQVQMDVRLPHGMPDEEASGEREQALQREGKWRHLWRIAGRYANVSIFDLSGPAGASRHPVHIAAVPLHGRHGDAALPASVVGA